jgi:hypothetical protein
MNALDAVYEQNNKRLLEARNAQKTQPQWMKTYLGGNSPATATQGPGMQFSPMKATSNVGPSPMMSIMRESQPMNPTNSGYIAGPGTNVMGQPGQASRTSGKQAAMEFWGQQDQAWNKANEDTLVDRGAMLQELAAFKANTVLSRQNMERTLADTEEKLRANTQEILDRVRNNFASMGRSASPYMMAELSKRLALQNKDKVNTTRSQLELDSAQIHGTYLNMLNDVLAGTKRSVMDPNTVMAMMKMLGEGDAGGGGVSAGGRIGGAIRSRSSSGGGGTALKIGTGEGTTSAGFYGSPRGDLTGGLVSAGEYRPGLNKPTSGSFVTNRAGGESKWLGGKQVASN